MRHGIIGGGNLGLDLKREFDRRGIEAALFTASNGFRTEDSVALMAMLRSPAFDVIWYCIGYGSVREAVTSPENARHYLVSMPSLIAKSASAGKRIVFFSSDYAACEEAAHVPELHASQPRSAYASLKIEMEDRILGLGRPNCAIVRVGSLFGSHKPEATFPGKLLRNFGFNDLTIRLPENCVTPTPTYWLAAKLIGNFEALFHGEQSTIHHCAPSGTVSVRDWGTFILNGLRDANSFARQKYFDSERPRFSALECSFAKTEHWHAVWGAYFHRAMFIPRERLVPVPLPADVFQIPPEETPETPAS